MEKAALYESIALNVDELQENNTTFIDKECDHTQKQIEKEIAKL
jgi:hypothetical protein